MPTYRSASGSSAEDLFIELFSDTFGAEKAGYLHSQYPFSDIYQNSRFADFLIENGGRKWPLRSTMRYPTTPNWSPRRGDAPEICR